MAKKAETTGVKVVVRNRRAHFDYDILDRYEAGMVLMGSEAKSIRAGRASLAEAYAKFDEHGELFLLACNVAEYAWANRNNHEPMRPRKLLLNKRELARLSEEVAQAGCTLVPIAIYLKKGRFKLELGVGKGKRLFDKRESVKKRTAEREMERGDE